MSHPNDRANDVVDALFAGDQVAAAAALNEMLDPARVAAEVQRKLGTERALDDFRQSHRDIAEDPMLARVADARLAEHLGGRAFHDLQPAEAAAALQAAGAQTRAWVRRVAPHATQEPEGAGPSAIIERMRRARGQA